MSSEFRARKKSTTPARAQASCISDGCVSVLFSLLALCRRVLSLPWVDTGWETIKALVFRPRVAELLSNTLWLTR
jgi:hypothetical protein